MLVIFFLDWTGLLDPCVWYQLLVEARNIRSREGWRVVSSKCSFFCWYFRWFVLVWSQLPAEARNIREWGWRVARSKFSFFCWYFISYGLVAAAR